MLTRFRPLPPRLSRRLGVLLLAMLQMGAAAVLPAVDGQLDIEVFGTPVHVESEGRDDCVPHHDHVFCLVVRATGLAKPSEAGNEVTALVAPAALPAVRDANAHRADSRARTGSASPRAPPSA